MRLDKILAHHGYGSRKQVKALIRSGVVRVNDRVVTQEEFHVDMALDAIGIQGETLKLEVAQFFLLNKPKGTICERGAALYPSVLDLIAEPLLPNTNPVGRLDVDTEGLLLLTSDGHLNHRLCSPKHHVVKGYRVSLARPLEPKWLEKIESGLTLDDGEICLPAKIVKVDERIYDLWITEGKYHQIKRMMGTCGNDVVYLYRFSYGPLVDDGSLKPGEYRRLTPDEIKAIKSTP
jgi:16S rRNA pseudouridine516 synthase